MATLDHAALGVAIADLSGTLLTEDHEAIYLNAQAELTTGRLITPFDGLLELSQGGQPVWRLGISLPGPVQTPSADGFLAETPPVPTGGKSYPCVETLMAHPGAPLWLRGSIETLTMDELRASDSERARNMVLARVEERTGAGTVIDGHLYRGSQGAAGLIVSPMASALAGMLNAGRLHSDRFQLSEGVELSVIAPAVRGGTSPFGSHGTVIGTIVGARMIRLINNGLILMGLEFSR